jgi:hypothetical protein
MALYEGTCRGTPSNGYLTVPFQSLNTPVTASRIEVCGYMGGWSEDDCSNVRENGSCHLNTWEL